jgi:hypothetical protein
MLLAAMGVLKCLSNTGWLRVIGMVHEVDLAVGPFGKQVLERCRYGQVPESGIVVNFPASEDVGIQIAESSQRRVMALGESVVEC